jgi:hypothetical protein
VPWRPHAVPPCRGDARPPCTSSGPRFERRRSRAPRERAQAVQSAGVATEGGTESPCTTVPADCIDTGSVATTGVDTAGSVSTVARAIAVSWVESVRATAVESKGRPAPVSGCANVIFRPNDSALGWLVGSVSATKVRGAGLAGEGVWFFASQAPIASDANTRTPKPFQT